MAENLREVALMFREGLLIEQGERHHAVITSDPEYPPTEGGFLAGPSLIVSVRRRQNGQWDIEYVRLVEAVSSGL